jgi:uncharacterized membrane protein
MTPLPAEEKQKQRPTPKRMPRFFAHLRKFIIRGTLALIPIALPAFALYLLYDFIDRRIVVLVEGLLHISFPGLGIILLLLVLYLVGLIVSNIFGRSLLDALEQLTERIPIIKTIYRMGKQLSGTLSQTADSNMFRRPVLVPYVATDSWQVGFVTGTVRSKSTGEEWMKVFVPTPPNPTTGLVYIVREKFVRDPGWTVEEAMQCLLSGGIIGPDFID